MSIYQLRYLGLRCNLNIMPNQSGKIALILIIIMLSLGALGYYIFSQNFKTDKIIGSTQDPDSDSQTYTSKDFQMTLKVPEDYKVRDAFPILDIYKDDQVISIVRNGTNYQNIEEYLKDFDQKRKVNDSNRTREDRNDYEIIKRNIKGPDGDELRVIYLYIDNAVYIFSTSDESLYPILDQIVQSFEYKP